MTTIVPTITTDDRDVYAQQIHDWAQFSKRVHIDITDGKFAPSRTLNCNQLYWSGVTTEIHMMVERPSEWVNQLVSLHPDLVILHAECQDKSRLSELFKYLKKFGIKVGLALLPETQPDEVEDLIKIVDSVLIFAGHLGYQGGKADLNQLKKVEQIKAINSTAIIEWDGGANISNVKQISQAGVDQINVGSAIARANNPAEAWKQLTLSR